MREPDYRLVTISHAPRRYEIYDGDGIGRGGVSEQELCRRALAHEKLVEACETVLPILRVQQRMDDNAPRGNGAAWDEVIAMLRAALAAAPPPA